MSLAATVPVKVDCQDMYNPDNFEEGINFATQYGNMQITVVVKSQGSLMQYPTSAYLEDL